MVLPIITNPNPILREKAKELGVEDIKSAKTKQLILNMIETMKKKDGIGLAAPQINKSLRIICIDDSKDSLVLINPKITWKSLSSEIMEEGCLSIPGTIGKVKRSNKIKVESLDQSGNSIKFKTKGIMARVIQHEIDHLNGALFIDKVI